MSFKMPKPVYQIFLGAFMLAFVTVACNNNKGDKEKEPAKDSVVAPPPAPVVTDSTKTGDSIINKPVDPGTTPKTGEGN